MGHAGYRYETEDRKEISTDEYGGISEIPEIIRWSINNIGSIIGKITGRYKKLKTNTMYKIHREKY
jgi:hypothetical protein